MDATPADVAMLLRLDLPVEAYDELVDVAYGDWPEAWPLCWDDLRAEGERLGRQFR